MFVVPNAYLQLGIVHIKREDFHTAKVLLDKAAGFDKFVFSGGFHMQLKNTQDFVQKKIEGGAQPGS